MDLKWLRQQIYQLSMQKSFEKAGVSTLKAAASFTSFFFPLLGGFSNNEGNLTEENENKSHGEFSWEPFLVSLWLMLPASVS